MQDRCICGDRPAHLFTLRLGAVDGRNPAFLGASLIGQRDWVGASRTGEQGQRPSEWVSGASKRVSERLACLDCPQKREPLSSRCERYEMIGEIGAGGLVEA